MSDKSIPGFDSLLAFAHVLADRSAEAILPYFRTAEAVDNKAKGGKFDPVTAADRAAEQVIREQVAAHMPAHAVLGEEFGFRAGSDGETDYCWVVDPIDGTRSFLVGYPLWGTLIGLNYQESPLLGLMNQPFTGERFWSGEDRSWYRGPDGERPIATRKCATLGAATLLSTGPDVFARPEDLARFETLSGQVRLRRYGGDCYCYCMLAAGHADLVVESGLQSYDIAPLIPLIERAGGRVTTWEGGSASSGGRIVASGNPALHEAAIGVLAG